MITTTEMNLIKNNYNRTQRFDSHSMSSSGVKI